MRYHRIDPENWSKSIVKEQMTSNQGNVLRNFPSIMMSDSIELTWKLELATDLLVAGERAERMHVWQGLCYLVRASPFTEERIFDIATQSMDNAYVRGDNDELGEISDFLSDFRIFGYPRPFNPNLLSDWLCGGSVARQFVALCGLANCGTTRKVVPVLKNYSASRDFLLREGAIDGVGILFTRSDLEDADVMEWFNVLDGLITVAEHDSHPHVQLSAETVRALQPDEGKGTQLFLGEAE
jgi:hypothetical protein